MRSSKINVLNLIKEKKRRLASKSLLDFGEYVIENFDPQEFHKTIYSYLDDLRQRKIKKLMIFVPPQHGKSWASSLLFPSLLLGINPNEKIILGCYNKDKAIEFVDNIKKLMCSPEYQEVFPNTKVSGTISKKYFEVNNGTGFVKAAGIDSGVTGTTATALIIDDPFKGDLEASSKTIRQRVWNSYYGNFKTRLDNDGIQLMLFTRWHEDDLAGRILDPNNECYDEEYSKDWKIVVFQALKEANNGYPRAEKIVDNRNIDDALWEKKHSASTFKIARRQAPRLFNALYQQRPTAAEGNLIKREWFVIKDSNDLPFNPSYITPQFFIDSAHTDKEENDPTAFLTAYQHTDGLLYILDSTAKRLEFAELIKYSQSYFAKNGIKPNSAIRVELKASGQSLKSILSKYEYGGYNVLGIDNKFVALGKTTRVKQSEVFIEAGKVVLVKGSWNNQFIEECCSFPSGRHDDQLDNLTAAINFFLNKKKGMGVSIVN